MFCGNFQTVRAVNSNLKTFVRFAGGGGRPGGKPAFNWKQKKILGIDGANSNRQFKLRPYGKFEDIKDFIKDKDVVLPFDGKDKSFEHEVLAAAIVPESYKKKIDVNQLYGSHKGCGMIPRKNNDLKLGYSYERVFGEKHRKLKEEKLKSMGMSDSAAQ